MKAKITAVAALRMAYLKKIPGTPERKARRLLKSRSTSCNRPLIN